MLTEQKKLFVDEYVRTGCKNATQAAKNAGYSPRSAASQAHDLLKTPDVQAYLNERKAAFVQLPRQLVDISGGIRLSR